MSSRTLPRDAIFFYEYLLHHRTDTKRDCENPIVKEKKRCNKNLFL